MEDIVSTFQSLSSGKLVSITFVRASANWAPLWTHRMSTPSDNRSLIDLANSCVRNSWQLGTAVRDTRSKRDLQSVTVMSVNCGWVAVVIVCGKVIQCRFGFFPFCGGIQESKPSITSTMITDPQYCSMKLLLLKVLIPRPSEFSCSPMKLETLDSVHLSAIFSWVVMIIMPVCESGFFFDENEASENARKRSLEIGIDWIVMVVSLCRLASCNTRLASIRFWIVAELMVLCKWLSRLDRSGRVFTAAYCKEPINARKACFSSGLTGSSKECFLVDFNVDRFNFGNVFFLGHRDTVVSILVKVNPCESKWLCLFGSKWKNGFKLCKFLMEVFVALHTIHRPTWTPMIPAGVLLTRFMQQIHCRIKRGRNKWQFPESTVQFFKPKERSVY